MGAGGDYRFWLKWFAAESENVSAFRRFSED